MFKMDQIHRIRELFYEQDKNLTEIALAKPPVCTALTCGTREIMVGKGATMAYSVPTQT